MKQPELFFMSITMIAFGIMYICEKIDKDH